MENNKKINLCLILSIVAIVLLIGVVICWILSTNEFAIVVPETFNSSCLGIISLAATFIVGYQIISTLDIKQILKDNDKKLEKSKTELQNDYDKFKSDMQNDYDKFKSDIVKSIDRLKKTNEDLMKSLEIEKKQRELLYQETKVAMYHGRCINNSALALSEQIEVIKLMFDINDTSDLKANLKLILFLIEGIHQKDFYDIQLDNKERIIGLNNRGIYKLNEYGTYIKTKLRELPNKNIEFIQVLILIERALDKKFQLLKSCSDEEMEAFEKEIDKYCSRIEEMKL